MSEDSDSSIPFINHGKTYHLVAYRNSYFQQVWDLLKKSFPAEQLDPRSYMYKDLQEDSSKTYLLLDSYGQLALVLITLEMKNFRFAEYLAVDPALRGQGLGTQFMTWWRKNLHRPILFECELATDRKSQKRLDFHQNCGFKLLKHKYYMPAVHRGDKPIPMHLLTDANLSEDPDLENLVRDIYREAYADVMSWPNNRQLLA